jgi:hypothetical protein
MLRVVAVLGVAALVAAAPASAARLEITALHAKVVRLGSYAGQPLFGVRIRATLCLPSALEAYPDSITITHYEVSKRRYWFARRTVVDRPPYLVPLGETWGGKRCGPVYAEDAVPPEHYGVESLGNPNLCYGVRLTIVVDGRRASRRAIVRCPFRTR